MSGGGGYDDDEDSKPKLRRGKDGFLRMEGRRYEFDCPECDANNPWGDGFVDGDEIRCNYCGQDFKAIFLDAKLKLKAI